MYKRIVLAMCVFIIRMLCVLYIYMSIWSRVSVKVFNVEVSPCVTIPPNLTNVLVHFRDNGPEGMEVDGIIEVSLQAY